MNWKRNLKKSLMALSALALMGSPLVGFAQEATPSAAAKQSAAKQSAAKQPAAKQPAAKRPAAKRARIQQDAYQPPALGVEVRGSPKGVQVLNTIPGSPAAKAGIQAGDYITDVNDDDIMTPQDLKKKIAGMSPFDTIDVTLWRAGKDVNVKVALAARAKTLPEHHRSWLGVILQMTSTGAEVDYVHPDSPAAKAGLQVGDVISTVNGKPFKNLSEFTGAVQDLGPGKELKMTIRRDGVEQSVTAQLAEIDGAPITWMLHLSEQADPGSASQALEELLNEMREELQTLKADVEELKAEPAKKDVSLRSAAPGDGVLFVQYGGGHRGSGYHGSGGYHGGYYGGYRSGYRGYGLGGFGLSFGSPYYYGYPAVAAPRYPYYAYPYQYYGTATQPYYYGSRVPYGYRGGLRIGPNFSLAW